ncbi:MAG: hypothetical protein Q4D38_12655 [Planctomycetia bacterium]|nr:hypothetical protein [Planctomycetia bacterium]
MIPVFDILEICAKTVGKRAVQSGEIPATPKTIDLLYGDGDGDIDFDDVTTYVENSVDAVTTAASWLWDILT